MNKKGLHGNNSNAGGGRDARFYATALLWIFAVLFAAMRLGGIGGGKERFASSNVPSRDDAETAADAELRESKMWYPNNAVAELDTENARIADAVIEAKDEDAKMDESAVENILAFPDSDTVLFENQKEFDEAPFVSVLPESKRLKYREVILHNERLFRNKPAKLFVPRLKKAARLSIREFAELFIFTSQPVIIPFESMRHLGFKMKGYTLDELYEMYPNHKSAIYKLGMFTAPREIDLGPAVAVLRKDGRLKVKETGRNYPRNMKIGESHLKTIGLQSPPYVLPGVETMKPSLWMGATTASTAFHSDCCDNFAMMIAGTKIWTVAPPTESRILKPKCAGGLCWVQKLDHPDEHAKKKSHIKLRDQTQLTTFELRAGEMLWLPAGWFHHIENKDPTVMLNYWLKGGPSLSRYFKSRGSVEI